MPAKKPISSKVVEDEKKEESPSTIQTIVLTLKGETKKAKLILNDDKQLTTDIIKTYFRKKADIDIIGSYIYDNYVLTLFGYKEGKKGSENKHILPPPYNEIIIYGDILIIASDTTEWLSPNSFSIEQYEKFYESAMNEIDDEETEEVSGEESEVDEEEIVEDDEEKEDEVGVEVEVDVEEEVLPKKKEAKKKKAPPISSGYQKQQQLLQQISFIELTLEEPLSEKRNECIKKFQFLTQIGFTKDDVSTLESHIYKASHIEADKKRVIKHWSNDMFCDIYRMIQLSIASNIHPQSPVKNPRLLARINDGELKLFEIPYLTLQEMYPENWQDLADRLLIREQKLLEGDKGSATDKFKCHRCGKRECTYYEMQTRSADEPMTIFISCLNCGKRWRQ
jgi:DNA-directed RNA polymerase subunit M/transcription elongation factor TFIIS